MGAVGKTIGALLTILGLLAFLGGGVAAAYGYVDEQENEKRFLPDPDRADRNEQLVTLGGVVGAAGLVLLMMGIIVLVAASGSKTTVVVPGPTGPSRDYEERPFQARKKGALVGLLAVGLLVGAAIMVAALNFDAVSGALAKAAGQESADAASTDGLLDRKEFQGTVQGGSLGGVGSVNAPTSDAAKEFSPPPGTQRVSLNLTWSPGPAGTAELRMTLEVDRGSGWTKLAEQEGPGPVLLSYADSGLASAKLRSRVFAADQSVSGSQAFSLAVESWSE